MQQQHVHPSAMYGPERIDAPRRLLVCRRKYHVCVLMYLEMPQPRQDFFLLNEYGDEAAVSALE